MTLPDKPVLLLPQQSPTAGRQFTLVDCPDCFVCLDRSGWVHDCAKRGRIVYDDYAVISPWAIISPGRVRRMGWDSLLDEHYGWLPAYQIADHIRTLAPMSARFDYMKILLEEHADARLSRHANHR